MSNNLFEKFNINNCDMKNIILKQINISPLLLNFQIYLKLNS